MNCRNACSWTKKNTHTERQNGITLFTILDLHFRAKPKKEELLMAGRVCFEDDKRV